MAGSEVRKTGGGEGLQRLVNSAGLQVSDEYVMARLGAF